MSAGIQGNLHGDLFGSSDFTLDTTTAIGLGIINGSWASIYNYKIASVNYEAGAHQVKENGVLVGSNPPGFTGADKHKIFVVFNENVGGTLTVRKY